MQHGMSGPFLQIAVFCEKVLQEKDEVLSAIRIIDRFVHTQAIEGAPDSMPPLNIAVSILVGFKSGDATGQWELKIRPIAPSGKELPGFSGPIFFEGEDRGANVVIQYGLMAQEEGLYWFEILLNNKLYTRMPLRITYQKKQVTSNAAPTVH